MSQYILKNQQYVYRIIPISNNVTQKVYN